MGLIIMTDLKLMNQEAAFTNKPGVRRYTGQKVKYRIHD